MLRTKRFFQLFLIVIFMLTALSSPAQDAELLRYFDYDQKAPLNLKRLGVRHRAHADVYDITPLVLERLFDA